MALIDRPGIPRAMAQQSFVIKSPVMVRQTAQLTSALHRACAELRPQGPEDEADDQDGHDKGSVRAELQRNKHQLHSNGSLPTRRWQKSYRAARATARCHSLRVAEDLVVVSCSFAVRRGLGRLRGWACARTHDLGR